MSQRADFFDVQAQHDADVLNSASGNPDAITFAGISTAHGTSAQMLAAINSGVTYGGIWLNVPR